MGAYFSIYLCSNYLEREVSEKLAFHLYRIIFISYQLLQVWICYYYYL